MSAPYYTDAAGNKKPFPTPAHHHDLVYVRQDQVAPMMRHRGIVIYQDADWDLPDNVDVTIGAYTDPNSVVVEWERASTTGPFGDVLNLGWTSSGVVIPIDGMYFVWARLDMTGNGSSTFDNGRLIFGATVNGATRGTQIERLHQSNSVVRTSTFVGHLQTGDVVSQRLKFLSATQNAVRGVEMAVFSIAPYGWSEDVSSGGGGGSGEGGHIIEDEGSSLPQRASLNFIGDAVTATDDPVNGKTNVTVVNQTPTVDTPLARVKAVLPGDFTLPENDGTNLTGWQAEEIVGSDLSVTADGLLVNVAGLYEVQSRIEMRDIGSGGTADFRANNVVGHSATVTDADPSVVIDHERILSNVWGTNAATMRYGTLARGVAYIEAGQTIYSRCFIDRIGATADILINSATTHLYARRLADVAQLGQAGPAGPPGLGVPPGGTTDSYLVKRSDADNDTEWVAVPPGGGGLSRSYTYYKHYKTNQTYNRGSWQTVKIGTTNDQYPSPTNNTQIHQFQIALSGINTSDVPNYVRFQYNQVEENDKTGPSSPFPWPGPGTSSSKYQWSHMYEHQGTNNQIEIFVEGSGTFVVDYIIVKCHSLAAP